MLIKPNFTFEKASRVELSLIAQSCCYWRMGVR